MNYFYSDYAKDKERRKKLVLHKVPETQNETTHTLRNSIRIVANACGYNLKTSDIVSVFRYGKKSNISNQPGRSISDPSPVVVKFINSDAKDNYFEAFMTAVSNDNAPTTNIFGGNNGERIFINHELSPKMQKILKKATEMKRTGYLMEVKTCYRGIDVVFLGQWYREVTMEQLMEFTQKIDESVDDSRVYDSDET